MNYKIFLNFTNNLANIIALISTSFGFSNGGSFYSSVIFKDCYNDLYSIVAQWCNPLNLKPEQSGCQSGRVGLIPDRTPPLERHDKGSRTRLGLLYFCDPSAWC